MRREGHVVPGLSRCIAGGLAADIDGGVDVVMTAPRWPPGSLITAALHAMAISIALGEDAHRVLKLHGHMFLVGGPDHGLGFGLLVSSARAGGTS